MPMGVGRSQLTPGAAPMVQSHTEGRGLAVVGRKDAWAWHYIIT